MRRGLALGCGGTLGLAWSAVALAAFEDASGWDAREADVLLGTSAGAELAVMLGSGRSTRQVLAALDEQPGADPLLRRHLGAERHPGHLPPLPRPALPNLGLVRAGLRDRSPHALGAGLLPRGRGDLGWMRDLATASVGPDGWVEHPATWLVAAGLRDGVRVAFGAPGAPPADLGSALAASWAVPGWFAPVRIGATRYVDGGAVSSVSADLLAPLGLDEVVVVAPMTSADPRPARGLSRLERLLRASMTRGLDREIAQLRAAGTRVVRLEPSQEALDAMGPDFMDLRRRAATLAAARASTPTPEGA